MVTRIDTESLKGDYPVADVVARYGIELRPSGRTLIGRCPFHPDRGRPNLAVYPASRSWYCFRCSCGGDIISFVERMEGIGFREAVERLQGGRSASGVVPIQVSRWRRTRPVGDGHWDSAERACLAAAVELYHQRLLTDASALAYIEGRGIDRATLERQRVGYAAGDELAAYLRWRRLPVQAAIRAGLVGRDGREFLEGRVVVPEIRAGQPIWLIGRAFAADPAAGVPKYLGLPGHKPLLGWESAASSETVWMTEGPFDWLTLRHWGLPALALSGTHVGATAVQALSRFTKVYLALDNDEAGRAAADRLARALDRSAVNVALTGVKDVAELATRPDGRAVLLAAVGQPLVHAAA